MVDMSTKSGPRALINIIGIPTIISIVWLGNWYYFSFIYVVLCLSAIELINLSKHQGARPSIIILLLSITAISINYQLKLDSFDYIFLSTGVIAFSYEIFRNEKKPLLNISLVILGHLWIGSMLGSLIVIRNIYDIGLELIFLTLFSVWACDSAAFLFGKLYGTKKILPRISPKKSWIGSISGLAFGIIISYWIYYFGPRIPGYIDFGKLAQVLYPKDIIILGLIYGGVSQIGDFFESLLKREVGIKDTSNLLKGHGGVLDRFDSLTVVAPSVYIYISFIMKGNQ